MNGYHYINEKPQLFTEEGQRMFIAIRDKAKLLIKDAGAFRMMEVIRDCGGGSSWQMLACVDRMVELAEIVECVNPVSKAAQHRIFTDKERL